MHLTLHPMNKPQLFFAASLFLAATAFAQTPEIGTPAWAAQHSQVSRQGGPQFNPQNGNDTLNNTYMNTACGLNYTTGSVRLGQRFVPVGQTQPAPIVVNFPSCATIDKAYLYTEALGVTGGITANLTNPVAQTTAYNMSLIGSSVDVCWGMNGTHVWRSDVTSSISGPGTYTLSGLPVSATASNSAVDVEGATLVIIYTDPYANYTGTMIIDDGCHTVTGGLLTHTMTGFSACANSTSASAFMLVGDMQMSGYVLNINNTAVTQPQWNWWNEISLSTSVTNGQSTCDYVLADQSDCFTLAVAGLYYQTGCSTCTPAVNPLSATTAVNAATCYANGSASIAVSGGTGNYSYLWVPTNQTNDTATGLLAGTYTVYVQDGSNCLSTTVTVPYNGASIAVSSTNVSCSGPGSVSVSVTGGVGPFTYLWSTGDTTATVNGLNSGNYNVIVTDQGTGCVLNGYATVLNNGLIVSTSSGPASCSASNGYLYATASGGQGPYNFLWQPGNYTTAYVSGVPAGTYFLTVTDSSGCTVNDTVTVGSTSGLNLSVMGGGSYSCGDTIALYASCSDPNATYSWSPAATLSNPNSDYTTSNATVTTTYTVTVTSASCGTATDTVTIYLNGTNSHVEEICFVTVDTATNKNIVIWERWNSPPSGSYNIYRETAVSNVYALIASQPVSQFSTYIDVTSNPQVMAERYKITTVDTCGNESDTSYHHRTIHLQTSPNGNGGWNLSWTAYEGLPIATYNIYRGASISTLTLLTQVAGNVYTYTDLNPPVGQQYYLVEAVHPFGGCSPMRLAAGSPSLFAYSSSISNLSFADPNGVTENALLENSLQLTPNPGSGNFQLTMSLGNTQQVQINVFDQLGRNVHTQTASGTKGENTVAMNLEGLSAGIYLVQVTTETGTATRRLVIQ